MTTHSDSAVVETFGYIECEIPFEMTLADYRRARATPKAGMLTRLRRAAASRR